MKQGTGKSIIGSTKVEPISRAINPAAVSEIGIKQVRTTQISLDAGRGYKAPPIGSSTHKSGSQGKH